jgi:hypothetical protein
MFYAVMHIAQVRLENGESSIEIEIEIGIVIDSVHPNFVPRFVGRLRRKQSAQGRPKRTIQSFPSLRT